MSAEAPLLSRTWNVGPRTVKFVVPRPKPGRAVHCACEWAPDDPRRLSPSAEWQEYVAGRNAALADMAGWQLGARPRSARPSQEGNREAQQSIRRRC